MNTAVMCLAMTLYFEARSETVVEQYRVAEVVMNRVDSPAYPDDVCAVVKQDKGPKAWDCQFSFYCDGKVEDVANATAFETALDISVHVLEGTYEPLMPASTMWYVAKYVDPQPSWAGRLERVTDYGAHYFYASPIN